MPAETFFPNQPVYFCPKGQGWQRGSVKALTPDGAKVEVVTEDGSAKFTVAPDDAHGIMDGAFDPRDADLFRVGDLHVSTLLYCLKARYEAEQAQYSKMGEMILSVNPFRAMPFNQPAAMDKYLASPDPMALDPHVWQIAHKCFTQIVVRDQGNQSVVISGESGSGKTENTKTLIAYLGKMSFKRSCNAVQRGIADEVGEKLKWSNPILESFGNARTVRNDNSSRFGKYTKLYFDKVSGVMVGGEMVTYLLEKSRIILLNEGERNYHVFYEMLAGLPADLRTQWKLKTARDYPSLAGGNTLTRRGTDHRDVNDAEEFKNLETAMDKMNINRETQRSIWQVLAAILHLQNVAFAPDDNDKACIPDESSLDIACELLGVNKELLKPCFLVISKTKIMTKLATKRDAEALRDAFAKALYVSLFDSMVAVVNEAIRPSVDVSSAAYVGVLDIFGFENFKKNSFEQLCINFANETLQNHYNKFTFLNDEDECRAEGIRFPQISFPDNTPCLQMFEQPKTGIFPSLDEECNFAGGTSARFTSNVWETCGPKEHFIRPKSTVPNSFGVHHYAADVTYNTDEWLEKNADALKEEAKLCVQQSTIPFVARILDNAETQASDGQKKKRVTVGTRFRSQLASLREELSSTESHFIRCIKPNMAAQPNLVDNGHVGMQLESAGVLQTITLKRQGYPIRRPHKAISGYFVAIAPRRFVPLHASGKYKESCENLLNYYRGLYGWQGDTHAVGVSKVFMKDFVYHKLEKLLIRKNRYRLKRCIPFLSAWAQRFRARKAEEERHRQEQLRRMQEEAENRRNMETQNQRTGAPAAAAPSGAGLDSERDRWFQEFCLLFPNFPFAAIADIARHAGSKDVAIAFLADMQKQQLDGALPQNLTRVFAECGFRPAVTEALALRGIDSIAKLEQLSPGEMRQIGMSDVEVQQLTQRLISQQSQVVVNEQLQSVLGTADFQDVFKNIAEEAREKNQQQAVRSDAKVSQLTGMGFSAGEAAKALAATNNDVAEAAMLLSTGQPIPDRPPQQSQAPPAAAPSRQATSQPASGTRPPPPQHQPRPAAPSGGGLTQNAAGVVPTMYNRSGGDDTVPRPGDAHIGAPQQQRQPAPQQRPPPPASRPVAGVPVQPQQQPPAGVIQESTINRYMQMGFDRQRVILAIQQCGGDDNAVLSMLLS